MFTSLTGVFVNFVLVILGSLAGVVFKKGIPERFSEAITKATGLCVFFIGVSGTLKTVTVGDNVIGANTLIMICSMVFGTALGTLADIDGLLNRLGIRLEKRFAKNENGTFAQGFVNATLIFCIGAMAITGPIQSALSHDHSTLIAKSVIDGITAMILASSLGIGVAFSSVPVFVYEGLIALIAYFAGAAFMTDAMNIQLIATGSLVICGISLNMLKITKIKVADMLPAIFIAPFIQWIADMF